jgi:hypothetical protein
VGILQSFTKKVLASKKKVNVKREGVTTTGEKTTNICRL